MKIRGVAQPGSAPALGAGFLSSNDQYSCINSATGDAFLIAAAADLLRVAQIYADHCPYCSRGIRCEDDYCHLVRAAIRKAKGEL